MESYGIQVRKTIIRRWTAYYIYISYNRRELGLFSTETDLQFTQMSLRSFNVQTDFFRKIIFKS